MVTSNVGDDNWAQVADLDEEQRLSQTVSRYLELSGLAEEERRRRLTLMARSEYSLPDDKLRLTTLARMRTLLRLEEDVAKAVSGSYDAVMKEMPGQAAWRRVSLVQTLVLEFNAEEEDALRRIIPTIFGGAPRRSLLLIEGASSAGPGLERTDVKRKKPFWAIWRRS